MRRADSGADGAGEDGSARVEELAMAVADEEGDEEELDADEDEVPKMTSTYGGLLASGRGW